MSRKNKRLRKKMPNPFTIQAPEEISPNDIASIFVEMYTDFPKLCEPINLFIHGPRGSGKSIMLRSLERQVQILLNDGDTSEVPFFAVHVPIKQSFFTNPEFRRLDGWKSTAVGEHLLSVYALQHLFDTLHNNSYLLSDDISSQFLELWEDCGGKSEFNEISHSLSFSDLSKFCEREARRVRQYFVRLPENEEADIYSGALIGFTDFILPFSRFLLGTEGLPSEPICFMVDDADNLTESMQVVLNTWVSSRASKYICFKVTTQLGYKTFRTSDGRIIESPHDYSEINIGSVYTSNKGTFAKRIEAIVKKRLENALINCSPSEFFPEDEKQKMRRNEIWDDLQHGRTESYIELKGSGSSRSRDLAQRYTIPSLMRELSSSRSSHTYSYSGLQSLIDLSSGVVRWFLEPASQMYHAVESSHTGPVTFIPVNIQDEEITEWSKSFRERLNVDPGKWVGEESDASLQSLGHSRENYAQLGNLLDAIGLFCRERLLDRTASEQRVFSFSLHDTPSEHLYEILHLGVRQGYLQKADLASKSQFGGRRPRYILTRRLGPHYRLDVSGYAAHLSVRSADLEIALKDPSAFVKLRLKSSKTTDTQESMQFGDG